MIEAVKRQWRQRPDRLMIVGLLIAHLLVLALRVGPILRHPSEYLLAPGGDGIKAYFAFLYYVQFDQGVHFSGMNYPYGELLTYTDAFPLLAWLLRIWKEFFGLSSAAAVGALNSTVLLASLPATPLVYVLIRRGGVGRWFAALASLAIVFLSPQFHRLGGGHLTLALPFAVPLLWYLQIRLTEATTAAGRWKWLALYVAAGFLLALIHPYYLLHALLLSASTGVVLALQQWRRRRDWWVASLWLIVAGLLPLVLVRVGISLLDTLTDRPTKPYGFLVYHANPASVFGPVIEPFASVFRFITATEPAIWEGYAYIGLPVLLGLIIWGLRTLQHLLRGHWRFFFRPVLPDYLRAATWATVPILVFAMAMPFVLWPKFNVVLDYVPELRQFRSLGRFAWIFYYVMAVAAVVQYWHLYRYLRQRGAARFGRLLLAFLLVVWGFEAKYQLEYTTKPLLDNRFAHTFTSPGHNYFELLAAAGHDPRAYQAILPLPYYAVGSEKFDLGASHISAYEGFRASLNLQRPLAAVMMSRSSAEHTLRQLELFSSDLTAKSWPSKLPSQRPLLVLASRLDSLRPAEKALLRRGGKLLTQTPQVALYELPLSAFNTTRAAQERAWFTTHRSELLAEGPLWRTAPGPAVVWESFAARTAPVSFTSPGAAAQAKGPMKLFEGPLPGAQDTTTYELSVWAHAKTTDWMPVITVRQVTPNGREVERLERSMKETTEISGDWARYTTPVRLQNPANLVVVEADGGDIVLDDLLIRPRSTNVYWLDAKGRPVLNGFPLLP